MALPTIPMQSIRYLVICAGGLFGFILLAILPTYQANVTLEGKIVKLKAEIEDQKTLYPLYLDLVKKSQIKPSSDLPFPKQEKLSKDETGTISDLFQELARKNSFNVISIVPDVGSLTDGAGRLKLEAVMTGQFMNLRNFLLQMGEIPYLDVIDGIQIRTIGDSKEFRFSIWVAQE